MNQYRVSVYLFVCLYFPRFPTVSHNFAMHMVLFMVPKDHVVCIDNDKIFVSSREIPHENTSWINFIHMLKCVKFIVVDIIMPVVGMIRNIVT